MQAGLAIGAGATKRSTAFWKDSPPIWDAALIARRARARDTKQLARRLTRSICGFPQLTLYRIAPFALLAVGKVAAPVARESAQWSG